MTIRSEPAGATVCFPGAGSFGSEWQPVVSALKPAAWIIRYPGRFGGDLGGSVESFDGLARACAAQVGQRSPGRPVLFGHSFGAYLAYATASALQQAGIAVSALVLAGANAPGCYDVPAGATGTREEVTAYLEGIDPGMLATAPSDEWRDVVLDTAAHDLRLLRQFDAAASAAVSCPILAVHGDTDPLASAAGVQRWQQYTAGSFSARSFPGGHSDFLRSPACLSWLLEVAGSAS